MDERRETMEEAGERIRKLIFETPAGEYVLGSLPSAEPEVCSSCGKHCTYSPCPTCKSTGTAQYWADRGGAEGIIKAQRR